MKRIKLDNLDETIYYEKLSNGLEIYMYPSSRARNFYLTYNTKFGSIDTVFKLQSDKSFTSIPQGSAHFLEHQLFQEGDNHTAFEDFSKLGSSVNAFTTYDLTCYEVVASTNFKENLITLLSFVENPVFKPNSIANEKNIIKEEIKMYENNPGSVSTFGLEYNLNINDNHKYTISGGLEDIKAITPEILYKTYDVFYQPGNMFLVLTGKFKPLEALAIIKEHETKREVSPFEKIIHYRKKEPIKVSNPYKNKEMDVSIPKIKIAYKMNKKSFKYNNTLLKIYLDALLSIKFGASSDALERLTNENLIANNIITTSDIRDYYVVITIELESEYIEEVLNQIRCVLSDLKISKEELERYKKSSISNYILSFNDIITVAENIQDDILTNNKITSNYIDIYKSLNLKEYNEIIDNIDLTNECVYILSKITE